MGADDTGSVVKSDFTLFEILDGLHDLGAASVTDLSHYVGLNKGTVYKHLNSLSEAGWVVNQEGTYRLSLKFYRYGMKRVLDVELCTLGKQKVVELANETGLPAGFMIKEGNRATRTAHVNKERAYQVLPETLEYPLHATASGKAILSTLPEREVRRIADETGLPEVTENTITDVDALLEELAAIDERGYALNREETSQRWSGVAAPVEHPDEPQVGALYLGWPRRAISDSNLDEVLDPLLAAADEIYLQLEY